MCPNEHFGEKWKKNIKFFGQWQKIFWQGCPNSFLHVQKCIFGEKLTKSKRFSKISANNCRILSRSFFAGLSNLLFTCPWEHFDTYEERDDVQADLENKRRKKSAYWGNSFSLLTYLTRKSNKTPVYQRDFLCLSTFLRGPLQREINFCRWDILINAFLMYFRADA